jgi:4-amino-4-deoxychorismate lyase
VAGYVVSLLGTGVVPADSLILRANDLGVVRGDGVFETIHVRHGQPWLLDEHLDRMARSAAQLAIDLPTRPELAGLAASACAAWHADTEGALRLICTRGPEDGSGPVTAYAILGPITDAIRQARTDGVTVVTATLGVSAGMRPEAPWLLAGVKSLSYAVHMASIRWAVSQGADDVLWVSSDGYALEGATSTLVWLTDGVLCTVPPESTGILAGTTAAWLLDQADGLGLRADHRMINPAGLSTMDGVWLTSSVRGLTEIRALDGVALAPSAHTSQLRELLGY